MGFLDRTVAAVCESLCAELAGEAPPEAARVAFASDWVRGQIGRMPRHYRFALLAATGALGLATLPGGQFFPAAPPARRRAALERWRRSRLGPRREVVRFFESVCILAYFSAEAPARPPAR